MIRIKAPPSFPSSDRKKIPNLKESLLLLPPPQQQQQKRANYSNFKFFNRIPIFQFGGGQLARKFHTKATKLFAEAAASSINSPLGEATFAGATSGAASSAPFLSGKSLNSQRRDQKYQAHYRQKHPIAIATAYGLKGSYEKLNIVLRLIRGLSAREAMNQLQQMDKRFAIDVMKCLKSAMFNAENHKGLNADRLLISECFLPLPFFFFSFLFFSLETIAPHQFYFFRAATTEEAVTNKGEYLKRLNPMGRSRFGIMHHPKCHLRIVLQEIPYKAGEVRLGKAGWRNSTWERFENFVPKLRPEDLDRIDEERRRGPIIRTVHGAPANYGVGIPGMENIQKAARAKKAAEAAATAAAAAEISSIQGYEVPEEAEKEDEEADYQLMQEEQEEEEQQDSESSPKKKSKDKNKK